MLLTLRCDPEREFCFYPVFFVGTPPFSLKRRAFFVLQRPMADFCAFWNALAEPRNCPHRGQKWTGWRRKASALSPAFSPRRPKSLDFARFGVSNVCRKRLSCCHSRLVPMLSAHSPVYRRNVCFFASGGYAPGCARKIGHSRDTRLTRADRWFPTAPVGTLPTAFGCVPAHIPRPVLQAFARKTAGWRTEWAGACTKGSHFAFGRPA